MRILKSDMSKPRTKSSQLSRSSKLYVTKWRILKDDFNMSMSRREDEGERWLAKNWLSDGIFRSGVLTRRAA